MKKYLIVIFFAILTGAGLAYVTLKKSNVIAIDANQTKAYLIQIGVYKSLDNASNLASNYENSIILNENNLYHVYTHLFTNEVLIQKVKKDYDEKNISCYIKDITLNKDILKQIQSYENLLVQTNDMEVINKTSIEMLKIYKESIG